MLKYTETKVGTKFYNLTGRPDSEILSEFPRKLVAEKIVALPDFNPGRSPLPTGSSVQLDQEKVPDWRSSAVSDVGCGMQFLGSSLSWDDFEGQPGLWDELFSQLKKRKNRLADLGRGNHFLDAATDDQYKVYFLIHTGSRNESDKATDLVNNPKKFDHTYEKAKIWAKYNRLEIARVLSKLYGEMNLIFDRPHNFYEIKGDGVVIYKGAVKVSPGEQTIIPSSMDGQMAVVEAKVEILEINGAISHGTGRIESRRRHKITSQNYDLDGLKKRIRIPDRMPMESLRGEVPSGYRPLDQCLELLEPLVKVKKRLTPIAYLGQL